MDQLRKCRLSSCVEQAAVALFAMRSMGLAVAHCTIPHWGNRSAGHDFNAILTKDNEWADFSAAKFNPGENEIANKPPKVFVKKFSRKMMTEDELEVIKQFVSLMPVIRMSPRILSRPLMSRFRFQIL